MRLLPLIAVLTVALFLSLTCLGANEETFPGNDEATASEETVLPPEAPPIHAGLDLQYSPIVFNHYQLSPGTLQSHPGNLIQMDLEGFPFDLIYGKLGIGFSLGYLFLNKVATGAGNLAYLNAYPLRGTLSYRFDYVHNQILVPFAKAAAGMTWVNQTGVPGLHSFQGFDYGGGIELCLNAVDPHSAKDLQRTIGIQSTYAIFEFARSQSFTARTDPDLSHDEYRVGLRFEM